MSTLFKKIALTAVLIFAFALPSFAEGPCCSPCQGNEKHCGDIAYEPQYQCDCAGVDFPLCSREGDVFQQCCQGLFVCPCHEGDLLCGGNQCYNPKTHGCCGGETPYSKAWEGCCEGKTYLLAYETCCGGDIVPKDACCSNKIIDPDTQGCCNGVAYDYATHACCNGHVCPGIPRVRLTPTGGAQCCTRDPSCFYATVDDDPEPFIARACDDGALITFPEALCPDAKVNVYQIGRCGESVEITGNAREGYKLQGVCAWENSQDPFQFLQDLLE